MRLGSCKEGNERGEKSSNLFFMMKKNRVDGQMLSYENHVLHHPDSPEGYELAVELYSVIVHFDQLSNHLLKCLLI